MHKTAWQHKQVTKTNLSSTRGGGLYRMGRVLKPWLHQVRWSVTFFTDHCDDHDFDIDDDNGGICLTMIFSLCIALKLSHNNDMGSKNAYFDNKI